MSLVRRPYPGSTDGELENNDFTDEIPFEYEEENEERNNHGKLTLEEIHKEVDRISEEYHLAPADVQILKDLFTCKKRGSEYGAEPPVYNVILLSDDAERSREHADELGNLIWNIDSMAGTSKIDAGQMIADGTVPTGTGEDGYSSWMHQMRKKISGCGAAILFNCTERPLVDVDAPSGTDRKRNLDEIKRYDLFWNTVSALARKNHKCTIIACMSTEVFKLSFSHDHEMTKCVFPFKVNIPESTLDDLYSNILNMLNAYEVTDQFAISLHKYLENELSDTQLPPKLFLEHLKNQILLKYYKSTENNDILDSWMIPEINTERLTPEEVLADLNSLIGLETVKKEFKEIYISRLNGNVGSNHHMMFVGNPGTAKTTVARLMAKLLHLMGIIRTDKLVEVKGSELLSEWRNGTGKKTIEKIKSARGGVLYIEEAYVLADNPMDSSNAKQVAVQTLMTWMEDFPDDPVVIFAGYADGMDRLLNTNEGLKSRISRTLHFEDYTEPELKEILKGFANEDGFVFEDEAEAMLNKIVADRKCDEHFGNGRDMRNLWAEIRQKWDVKDYVESQEHNDAKDDRIIRKELLKLLAPEESDTGITELIGLKDLKEKINDFKEYMVYLKTVQKKGIKYITHNRHMAFVGNPGTGKTTVAVRLVHDLYGLGVTKSDKCVVIAIADLVKDKDPTGKILKYIQKAIGGMLFIDEAYALAESDWGFRIIEVLLIEMEKHKDDIIFVFAGYTVEMKKLFAVNPGLESRIGYIFDFPDYTLDELYRIFQTRMNSAGYVLCDDVEEGVKEVTDYFMDIPHFGNGRFIENVIKETLHKRARRQYNELNCNMIDESDIPTVQELQRTIMGGTTMYDPTKLREENLRRTAIHELGHALVLLLTDPDNVPESISIRGRSSSLGRVTLSKDWADISDKTEQWCLNHIAALLAGKNAERILLGDHSAGCSNDYERAKNMAKRMLKEYAMGQLGVTKKKDILRKADERSCKLIGQHRDFIELMVEDLLSDKIISGEELRARFNEYMRNSESANQELQA